MFVVCVEEYDWEDALGFDFLGLHIEIVYYPWSGSVFDVGLLLVMKVAVLDLVLVGSTGSKSGWEIDTHVVGELSGEKMSTSWMMAMSVVYIDEPSTSASCVGSFYNYVELFVFCGFDCRFFWPA